MNSRFVWIFGILAVLACAKPRGETPHSLYGDWMQRLDAPITVTASELDGIWERTSETRLYRDSHDESYNDATSTDYDKSGELLIFTSGEVAKESLFFKCPHEGDEPLYLLKEIESDNTDLKALADAHPDTFKAFTLAGSEIQTTQVLRGPKLKPEPFSTKLIKFAPDQEGAAPNLLQIAFTHKDLSFGVHTVIETYHRLQGEALLERLKAAREAEPCAK